MYIGDAVVFQGDNTVLGISGSPTLEGEFQIFGGETSPKSPFTQACDFARKSRAGVDDTL